MGQRSIRFPDEFEARLAALAEADGRTFSNYVLRTLEKALDDGHRTPLGSVPRDVVLPARFPSDEELQANKRAMQTTGRPRLGKGFVPPRPKGK